MQWLPVFTGVLQDIYRREGADRADSKALAAELARVEGLDKNNKAVSELIREVDNAARYGTPDYLEFVTTGDEGDKNRKKNSYVSIHTYRDAIETLEVFSGRVETVYKDQNTSEAKSAKAAADMVNALKDLVNKSTLKDLYDQASANNGQLLYDSFAKSFKELSRKEEAKNSDAVQASNEKKPGGPSVS